LPVLRPHENGDGFIFVFRRSAASNDYSVRVELSDDLKTWQTVEERIPGNEPQVDTDYHGPGIDRITLRIPENRNNGGHLFVRLVVGAL
jgi:hypothetical protein